MASLGAIDQVLLGYNVHFYSYGCPKVGEMNWVNYFNKMITATNLRAVFNNDPVPSYPFDNYYQEGAEIHFYNCTSWIAYPLGVDDVIGAIFGVSEYKDHDYYHCLADPTVSI